MAHGTARSAGVLKLSYGVHIDPLLFFASYVDIQAFCVVAKVRYQSTEVDQEAQHLDFTHPYLGTARG